MRATTRFSLALPAAACALAAVSLIAAADDDGGDDDAPPPAHDVSVQLGRMKDTRRGTRVRVRVRNRGRSAAQDVRVALWSDAQSGAPVWETTTDLRRRGHRDWKLVLPLPEGTSTLTASCDLDGDEVESNDEDWDVVPAAPDDALAAEGAGLWNSLCSTCHGADGTGGAVHEDVSRKDAGGILEAVREGEGGMPTFAQIDAAAARAIVAFLRNPDVAVPPVDPPPVDPPPTDPPASAPTWTTGVSAIFTRSCTACHGGTNAPLRIRLDTYANAVTNAARSVDAIAAGRMPPGGGFPASDLQTLRDWIAAGKPR